MKKRCYKKTCGDICKAECLPHPNIKPPDSAIKLFHQAISDKNHHLHLLMPEMLRFSKQLRQPPALTERGEKSFLPQYNNDSCFSSKQLLFFEYFPWIIFLLPLSIFTLATVFPCYINMFFFRSFILRSPNIIVYSYAFPHIH